MLDIFFFQILVVYLLNRGITYAEMDREVELACGDGENNGSDVIKPDGDSLNYNAHQSSNDEICAIKTNKTDKTQEVSSHLMCPTPRAGAETVSEASLFKSTETADLGDTSALDAEGRNQLFAQGVILDRQGKKEEALKHYLSCLHGLSKETRFVLLPQCLRNIAEIYFEIQELDKAIHFIQAEKLYYENALINTEEIKKKLDEMHLGERSQDLSMETQDLTAEVLRADEYEHLAKLCMDHRQPHLAMEYAGKCSRVRRHVLGENHPKTKESLDLFASLYAEAGKQQYMDSLEAFSIGGEDTSLPETPGSEESPPITPTTEGSPVSILRNRKNSEREKKQVRFHESVVDHTRRQQGTHAQNEMVSRTLISVLLFISCILLSILGMLLYCRVIDSHLCHTMTDLLQDTYLQIRYQYYKYTSTKHVKFA